MNHRRSKNNFNWLPAYSFLWSALRGNTNGATAAARPSAWIRRKAQLAAFLVAFVLFSLAGNVAHSQQQNSIFRTDTSLARGLFSNAIKSSNEYVVGEQFYTTIKSFGSTLDLRHSYRGTSELLAGSSSNDYSLLSIDAVVPVSGIFSAVAKQRWMLSSSRSDRSERLNFSAGARSNFLENSFAEATVGYEKNNQVKSSSEGVVWGLNSEIGQQQVDNFLLHGNLFAEFLKLKNGRSLSDFNANAIITNANKSEYDFSGNAGYKIFGYDLIPASLNSSFFENLFLTKTARTASGSADLKYMLSERIASDLLVSISNSNLEQSYNRQLDSVMYSKVVLARNDLNIGVRGAMDFRSEWLVQSVGLEYLSQNSENTVRSAGSISSDSLSDIRAQEARQDYVKTGINLFTNTLINLGAMDGLRFDYSVSLLQDDKPSALNQTAQDIFTTIFSFSWEHRFSSIFAGSLTGMAAMKHIVYLKAANSANNQWYRRFSIVPSFVYSGRNVRFVPSFELAANYTAYDYANKIANITSTSQRYIATNDTVIVSLGAITNISALLQLRYEETANLFWDEFKESPQDAKTSQFYKLMLNSQPTDALTTSVGGRYFVASSRYIGKSTTKSRISDYFRQSFGVETALRYSLGRRSSVSISGWYEFFFESKVFVRSFPNFLISANYYL